MKLPNGEDFSAHQRQVLPPNGRSVRLSDDIYERLAGVCDLGSPAGLDAFENVPASITFTDAAGVRWRRDYSGDLERMA